MTSPEVSEERLEALLAGAAPATPAEEELLALMTEVRGEPEAAPAGLRARVRAIEVAPSAMERLRAALTGPGLRRSVLVAAPACSLALAAGVVIGIGQSPSPAPPAPATTLSTESPRTAEPPARGSTRTEQRGAAPDAAPANAPQAPADAPQAPTYAPAPSTPPAADAAAPIAIEAAPTAQVDRGSVSADGAGARVLPDTGSDEEREAAHAQALADALADAAQKAERAADRAGVELGPPEAVAVESPQVPTCAPAPAAAPAPAGTPATAPAPEGGPAAPAPAAGTCTVAADVSVTYPATEPGTSASPPSP